MLRHPCTWQRYGSQPPRVPRVLLICHVLTCCYMTCLPLPLPHTSAGRTRMQPFAVCSATPCVVASCHCGVSSCCGAGAGAGARRQRPSRQGESLLMCESECSALGTSAVNLQYSTHSAHITSLISCCTQLHSTSLITAVSSQHIVNRSCCRCPASCQQIWPRTAMVPSSSEHSLMHSARSRALSVGWRAAQWIL